MIWSLFNKGEWPLRVIPRDVVVPPMKAKAPVKPLRSQTEDEFIKWARRPLTIREQVDLNRAAIRGGTREHRMITVTTTYLNEAKGGDQKSGKEKIPEPIANRGTFKTLKSHKVHGNTTAYTAGRVLGTSPAAVPAFPMATHSQGRRWNVPVSAEAFTVNVMVER